MTILSKSLRRETLTPFDHNGRNIVIEIQPPGLVSFREKGRKKKWTAGAAMLMQWVMEHEYKKRMLEKKKTRKAKRGLLSL